MRGGRDRRLRAMLPRMFEDDDEPTEITGPPRIPPPPPKARPVTVPPLTRTDRLELVQVERAQMRQLAND